MIEYEKMLSFCKFYLLYVCKQKKKRNSKMIPLIYSFCSEVVFLKITLLYNELFSVLHYLWNKSPIILVLFWY